MCVLGLWVVCGTAVNVHDVVFWCEEMKYHCWLIIWIEWGVIVIVDFIMKFDFLWSFWGYIQCEISNFVVLKCWISILKHMAKSRWGIHRAIQTALRYIFEYVFQNLFLFFCHQDCNRFADVIIILTYSK